MLNARIEIFTGEDYILGEHELQERIGRDLKTRSNRDSFRTDFTRQELTKYNGSFVAYTGGIFCGQSRDNEALKRAILENYRSMHTPNTTVFHVPGFGCSARDALTACGEAWDSKP